MEKTKKILKRQDLILAAVMLGLALILGAGYAFTHQTPAAHAEITVDGELMETLDLSEDQEITIHGANGGTNHLVIKDGEIWCSEASCPDLVCVHQGKQSLDGSMIVCLPNRMIVQVRAD